MTARPPSGCRGRSRSLQSLARFDAGALAPVEGLEAALAYGRGRGARRSAVSRDRAVADPERLTEIEAQARRHRQAQAKVRGDGGRDPGVSERARGGTRSHRGAGRPARRARARGGGAGAGGGRGGARAVGDEGAGGPAARAADPEGGARPRDGRVPLPASRSIASRPAPPTSRAAAGGASDRAAPRSPSSCFPRIPARTCARSAR